MKGWAEDRNRVTGLAFAAEDAGWPTVCLLSGDPDTPIAGALRGTTARAGTLTPCAVELGCVSLGSGGQLKDQRASDVANTLVFGSDRGDLSVTLSRLSPAILLESKAGRIELFAREEKEIRAVPADAVPPAPGAIKPLRWATPDARGTVRTGILARQQVGELPNRLPRPASLAEGGPSLPPVQHLDGSWLLLWYGSDSPFVSSKVSQCLLSGTVSPGQPRSQTLFQADVPLLLVFQRAPASVELKEDAGVSRLLIGFEKEAGKVTLVPVFGHLLRPAGETEGWLLRLPDDVKARCDAWAEQLAEFPVDVKETVAFDLGADRVTVTDEFVYERLRAGGKRAAPVAPMLALAFQQGLQVRFSATPADLKAPTQFGPTMAIPGDKYAWSLDGLGKAVASRPQIGPPAAKSAELEKELAAEVDKVIAAGHLAPWRQIMRHFDFQHFTDPSDTLYYLCEVFPVLPARDQARLREYLRAEYDAYPPHKTPPLPLETGARREIQTAFPEGYFKDRLHYCGPTYIQEPEHPIYQANGVAKYFETIGQKPPQEVLDVCRQSLRAELEARDWASLAWFWGKYSMHQSRNATQSVPEESLVEKTRLQTYGVTLRHVHRDAAGLIGYLRLCKMAGQPEDPQAWGQLARLTALRFAMARYGQYLATNEFFAMPDDPAIQALLRRTRDFSKPENHMQQVLCVNQHGVLMHACITKELGQYNYTASRWSYCSHASYEVAFQDLTPEFANILAGCGLRGDAERFLQFFEELQSTWFARHTDILHLRSEEVYMHPTDSHELLMAHAWLAGTPPEKMERYIDEPWTPVGDLFYMHKLAETIKAYRGVKWVEPAK